MKLACANLPQLLPDHLGKDPGFAAASLAAKPFLDRLAKAIPNLLIYARLGEANPAGFLPPLRRLTEARPGLEPLSEELLESLAWQFHVDFREAAKTRSELAAMVRNSIAWHRIKGTPASIKAALDLFGFGGIYIDEHDRGMHWATYQLGFDEVGSLEDLARILKICWEMQPARCRLWRVYTSDYDFRPGVWSGAIPKYAWSECWWSSYSGSYFPDLPGLDDRGLLVSFGLRRRFLCEQYALGLGLGRSDIFCERIPIFRYPVWCEAHWSEYFPQPLPFAVSAVIPLHGCEYIFEPELPWYAAPWQDWPWARSGRWDRRHPQFSAFFTEIPFAQECWSDAVNKGDRHHWWHDSWPDKVWPDAVWPGKVCKSGGWSAENSFWGTREILITANAPKWGEFRWSDNIEPPIYKRIDEFFYDYDACLYLPVFSENPGVFPAVSGLMAFLLGGWPRAEWPDTPWQSDILAFASQILAGHCETFLVNAWADSLWPGKTWPDAIWPDSFWPEGVSWQSYTACHAAIAHWLGMAWQTVRLKPANPFSWQLSLLASRISRRSWPNAVWRPNSWDRWLDGALNGQKQLFAEKIAIGLANCPVAFAPILTFAAPAKEERKCLMAREDDLARLLPALYAWPDSLWPDKAWLSGYAAAQGRILAENIPLDREDIQNSSQNIFAEKIPVNAQAPEPVIQSQAAAARIRCLDAWPDSSWMDAAWQNFRNSELCTTQLHGQKYPENLQPCCQGASQIRTIAARAVAPDCNFAPCTLSSALAGNGPRFTAWTDGAWPAHTWDKILGYGRSQPPFTISVKTEVLEV